MGAFRNSEQNTFYHKLMIILTMASTLNVILYPRKEVSMAILACSVSTFRSCLFPGFRFYSCSVLGLMAGFYVCSDNFKAGVSGWV
jgi:hypothetical protein